jgi:hypothetical protein
MSYERAGLLVASTAALAYAFNVYKQQSSSRPPLPPSPGGSYPFLGHALDLSTDEEHLRNYKVSHLIFTVDSR